MKVKIKDAFRVYLTAARKTNQTALRGRIDKEDLMDEMELVKFFMECDIEIEAPLKVEEILLRVGSDR